MVGMATQSNFELTEAVNLSVFSLLTRLSEITVVKINPTLTGRNLNDSVRKARSSFYSTLLGKKNVKDINAFSGDFGKMSPLSWLIALRFLLSQPFQDSTSSELDIAIRKALEVNWHELPHPVLRMLIFLASTSSSSHNTMLTLHEPFSLSFQLGLASMNESRKPTHDPRLYQVLAPEVFIPPQWMSVGHCLSPFGHYITSFPFNCKPGEGLPLLGKFSEHLYRRSSSEDPLYRLRPIHALTRPEDLIVPSSFNQANLEDDGYFTPLTDVANRSHVALDFDDEDRTKVWAEALQVSLPSLKSWETLGNLTTHPEQPFLTSASPEAVLHFSTLVQIYHGYSVSNCIFDSKPTSRIEFHRDVFLLLVGIESVNFPFNEHEDKFFVREGMWLEGYSANDFSVVCQDFLYCGSYFRRLEKLAHSSNTSVFAKCDSLVVQALIKCVQHWTQFYRGAILILSSRCQPQGNKILLYELLEYIQHLKEQIICLSNLYSVENFGCDKPLLLSGVPLLAHLYREVCKSYSQQSHLLYSAFKSCCEVYLRCLQKWIFLGECSDVESEEFFVHKDPFFSKKQDRSFWVKGFIMDYESVPVFLQGLEVAIFDCGRAMNLLRLCNPHHPLCILLEKQHPTIYCCLYKSDMEKVIKECAQFEKDAQKMCGEFTDVSKLLEEEIKHEARLLTLMREAQHNRDIAYNSIRIQLEIDKAKLKQKQNEELKAQMLEIQQRKTAEKEQQQREDKKYLEECKRQETAARMLQEEERRKVLSHYAELGKAVCKKNLHRDWQMKRLKLANKRQTFLYESSLSFSRENQSSLKSDSTSSNLDAPDVVFPNQNLSVPVTVEAHVNQTTRNLAVSDLVEDIKQEKISLKMCAQDLFQEASLIKSKVLQVEYGLSVVESTGNTKSVTEDHCSTPLCDLSCNLNTAHEKSEMETHADKRPITPNIRLMPHDVDWTSELERNRRKVLFENVCWIGNDCAQNVEKSSEDSGVMLDWQKNRKKVLGSELNRLTSFVKSDVTTGNSLKSAQMNLCTPNLPNCRSEHFHEDNNVATGKGSLESIAASIIGTRLDSGVDAVNITTASDSAGQSDLAISPCGLENTSPCRDQSSLQFKSERPAILSVSSRSSAIVSPLMTPQNMMDMPVFTSPFKGTTNLPNGLPLASPLVNLAFESVTHFEVNGLPLMEDIADKFTMMFDLENSTDTDLVDHQSDSETAKTIHSASWLESSLSLQTCLLLPLRVQYRYVSAALLHVFLDDLKVLNDLKSLRSYYFMQDGEFGRHLTVKLFSQMYQVPTPDKLFNSFTLDRIMKEALTSSKGTLDPNHSKLSLTFENVPDHFSHSSPNVLDCLKLNYKVKWPLNLLLTPGCLDKYNVIFVFLVRLKRVAWLLQEDFVALKNTARGCLKEQSKDLLNSPQYHQVQMVRHCMSQFVQATLNYISCCVLHASWADFASSLKQATTIDHIYNAHTEYIKRLLKRCLLNSSSKRVEVVLSKILRCIIKFHSNLRVKPWQLPSKQNDSIHSALLEHPNFQMLLACSAYFKLHVSKLLSYLERLISPANQQQHLAEYLLLLNVNGFYKSADYLQHVEKTQESDLKSALSCQSTSKYLHSR